MPKHKKYQSQVPSLEDYRAPWVNEVGGDPADASNIDPEALRRYIHGLLVDKARAQDARDAAEEAREAAVKQIDDVRAEAAKTTPAEVAERIGGLERQVADLTAERDAAVQAKDLVEVRSKVLAGVPAKYHDYVSGSNEEELTASLARMRETFGLGDGEGVIESGGFDRSLRQPARDGGSGAGDGELDFDKVALQVLEDGGRIRL